MLKYTGYKYGLLARPHRVRITVMSEISVLESKQTLTLKALVIPLELFSLYHLDPS